MAGGDGKEAGKYHEGMRQTSLVESGDAFGPWVWVTRKRKSFRKALKDKGLLPSSGSDSQSPRSQPVSDPFKSTLGSNKDDGDRSVGKQKPMRNPMGRPSRVESVDKPNSLTKPPAMVSLCCWVRPKVIKVKEEKQRLWWEEREQQKDFPNSERGGRERTLSLR